MAKAGDVRTIALGLPEAREASGAFTVRKVEFARLLDDGEVAVHVDLDERDRLDDLLFEAWRRCAPPAISRHPAGSRPRRG